MNDKIHFSFIVPLGAWVASNLTTINGLLQAGVFLVAIVGGLPAFVIAVRKFNTWRKRKDDNGTN
jgi:hypothetical protein